MTFVRPSVTLSVRLSVTLVDCDHTVQQKAEIGPRQDRSVSWRPACWSRSGSFYPVIPDSTEEDSWVWKTWTSALRWHPSAHMSRYLSVYWAYLVATPRPLWKRVCVRMCVCVCVCVCVCLCMSVCLCKRIFRTINPNFIFMLPAAVAWSSGGVVVRHYFRFRGWCHIFL